MKFKGKIAEIIYTNEENGYSVIVFDAEDRYFTAVGIFPLVAEGEYLIIEGEFKHNKKYGEQFVGLKTAIISCLLFLFFLY